MFPQLLLCGLLVPRDQMADVLDAASSVLPLTYAYEGLQRVTAGPGFDSTATRDLAIVLAVTASRSAPAPQRSAAEPADARAR